MIRLPLENLLLDYKNLNVLCEQRNNEGLWLMRMLSSNISNSEHRYVSDFWIFFVLKNSSPHFFFFTRRTVTFIVPLNDERRNESASMLSQRMIIRFAHLLPLKGLMLDSLNEPYLRCNFSSTTCISHQIWLIFLLPRFIHSIRQNYSGWV